jgi:hypothetical protein
VGPNSFLPTEMTAIERKFGADNSRYASDRSTMRTIRSLRCLCRVPFDVGEEDSDGAGGEIGHRPSPKVLAWRNLGWIVAWFIIRDEAQRVPDCSGTRRVVFAEQKSGSPTGTCDGTSSSSVNASYDATGAVFVGGAISTGGVSVGGVFVGVTSGGGDSAGRTSAGGISIGGAVASVESSATPVLGAPR